MESEGIMKEAVLYNPLEGGKVQCHLCNHRCIISPSQRGICGVRENREGKLYTLVFGRAVSLNVDPIEKKPIFHLYPGSTSLSFAAVGQFYQHFYPVEDEDMLRILADEYKKINY